jgi:hypothetical protein
MYQSAAMARAVSTLPTSPVHIDGVNVNINFPHLIQGRIAFPERQSKPDAMPERS